MQPSGKVEIGYDKQESHSRRADGPNPHQQLQRADLIHILNHLLPAVFRAGAVKLRNRSICLYRDTSPPYKGRFNRQDINALFPKALRRVPGRQPGYGYRQSKRSRHQQPYQNNSPDTVPQPCADPPSRYPAQEENHNNQRAGGSRPRQQHIRHFSASFSA